MTPEQAAQFEMNTVATAKQEIIKGGYVDETLVMATCKRLADMLTIDIDTVIEMFEKA